MNYTHPTRQDLEDVSERLNIDVPTADQQRYRDAIAEILVDLESVHGLSDADVGPAPVTTTFETRPYHPDEEDDPNNAWITKCRIDRGDGGPLSDITVGLKDSIALAGVEMTCGSRLLEDYVPQRNATVVDRLLESGATIRGKCNMESLSFSASSDTSDFGRVHNPHDPDRIAGGSSSGSAAAVAAGDVDVALGCDQGASIRVPASCCGVVGLDPTTGLVPYTGIFPMDPTIDHVGPIARTVEDVARTLEVIAGSDGLDSRQPRGVEPGNYTDALDANVTDLRVGVLKEGFHVEDHDRRVTDAVRDALDAFATAGAETVDTSLPMLDAGVTLGYVIWGYGALQVFKQGGQGVLREGWYDTELMEAFGESGRSRADDLPAEGKLTLLAMQYLEETYGGVTYGKAQNLRKRLQRDVEDALSTVDVLALPTMPTLPLEFGDGDGLAQAKRTITLCHNTAPFSLTNHPSVSIPCGWVDDLPVGLMFVADRFNEETLLQAAAAFERQVEATPSGGQTTRPDSSLDDDPDNQK